MMYKLRDWIDINKLNWKELSKNTRAIHILELNLDKIDWFYLSHNPQAIHILAQNIDKINWSWLSANHNAINLLALNKDKIDWCVLLENKSIYELDYDFLKKNCNIFKKELIEKAMHPLRIKKLLDSGIEIEDLDNYI